MSQLVRFTPATEMQRLQREVDSLFRDFFGSAPNGESTWSPALEIRETEEAYLVQVDVPGVRKEDIQVDYHNGTLSVSGERRMEEKQEGEHVVRVERRYGTFYRAFTLPMAIRAEGIRATCEGGVLRVEIPKAEESKPRRITVG